MKKYVLYIFVVLSLFLAAPASAANFVEICRDPLYLIYVDTDSIKIREDYTVVWVKWIPRGEKSKELNKVFKKNVDYSMTFTAYKNEYTQYQDLALHIYYKDGQHDTLFSHNVFYNGWEEIIPQTYGELIYNYIAPFKKDWRRYAK